MGAGNSSPLDAAKVILGMICYAMIGCGVRRAMQARKDQSRQKMHMQELL
jgi:hypothetical protein